MIKNPLKSWEGFRGLRQFDYLVIRLLGRNGRIYLQTFSYEGTRTKFGCFWKFWEYPIHRLLD